MRSCCFTTSHKNFKVCQKKGLNLDTSQFAELTPESRLKIVKEVAGLTQEQEALLRSSNEALSIEKADSMVENVVGTYQMPYSIATDFVINGKEYLVPMVGEEPFVTQSLCGGALLAKNNGGFTATNTGAVMIAQIELVDIPNPYNSRLKVFENKASIIQCANEADPVLISLHGGCYDVDVRVLKTESYPIVVVHLLIDTKDAMGAQVANAMAEKVAPMLEKITAGRAELKVVSNLASQRLVRVRVHVRKEDIGCETFVDKLVAAYEFATTDRYRATTNNKGVMNGIIPVVLATGNDTRAVEAGVHSYASISGSYKPVTIWEKNTNGDLEGMIEVPMAVGTVGGTTKVHPLAQLSLKILKVESALELAQVIAAAGLAANLGVLKTLTTVGLYADFDASHKRSK